MSKQKITRHHMSRVSRYKHGYQATEHNTVTGTVSGSHDQQVATVQRSRRQQIPEGHTGSGSGSGVGNVTIVL